MTLLEYHDSQFHEVSGQPTADITLKFDSGQKKLILSIPGGVSMIQRRAAERGARSIASSGFQLKVGGRIGRGFELVIEGGGGGLPDRLTHSPREVY